MSANNIWSVLGLDEPSYDNAVIRRAYARRLKETHPEDDPKGFQDLRQAYETALRVAEWNQDEPDDDAEDEFEPELEAFAEDDVIEHASSLQNHGAGETISHDAGEVEDEQAEEPSISPEVVALDDCFLKIAKCYESPWQGTSDIEAYEELIRSPALAQLDVQFAVEHRLLNLIHYHRPRSLKLLQRAIEDFEWWKAQGDIDQNSIAARALALRDEIFRQNKADELIQRVKSRKHEFHRAYKTLRRRDVLDSFIPRLKTFLDIPKVKRFLFFAQHKVPNSLYEFDYDVVDWWRMRIARTDFFFGLFSWAKAAVYLLCVFAAISISNELDGFGSAVDGVDRSSLHVSNAVVKENCRQMAEDMSADEYDAEDALECGAEAVDRMPESLMMHQFAAIYATKTGDFERAQTLFQSILEVHPTNSVALMGLGLAQSKQADDFDPLSSGGVLMRQALELDYQTRFYFTRIGLPAPPDLQPTQGEAPVFIQPDLPNVDKLPDPDTSRLNELHDQMAHDLGMAGGLPAGEVGLICFMTSDGQSDDCKIIDETPANQGLGEVALYLLNRVEGEPGMLYGEPVDNVPFLFRLSISD